MKEIIEELKEQGIKMRPKWHFIVQSILLIALTVLALLLTLFFVSFLLFCLERSRCFFSFTPLILLLVIVLFLFIVEALINRYAVSYRKPVIYSLIALIFIIFILGFLVNRVHFHEGVERRNLPVIKRMYEIPVRKPSPKKFDLEKKNGRFFKAIINKEPQFR